MWVLLFLSGKWRHPTAPGHVANWDEAEAGAPGLSLSCVLEHMAFERQVFSAAIYTEIGKNCPLGNC